MKHRAIQFGQPKKYELTMCETAVREVKAVTLGDALLGYRTMQRRLQRSPWNHALGRFYEIEKIMRDRHGPVVPETDDAFIYAEAVAAVLYVEFGEEFIPMMNGFMKKWYPWATQHQIDEVVYDRVSVRFRPIAQDALGQLVHLTDADRTRLDIRTIGACDVTAAERKRRQKNKRRKRDREAKEGARRTAGALPREEYLARSLTRLEPWKSFGCSRRTWERRGCPPALKNGDFPDVASA